MEEHIATTKSSSTTGTKTLFDLQAEILKQPKLVNSVSYADGSSIRDGILKRAPSEMAAVASQWRVHPSSLARQTAEMINFNAYLSGAAQNPKKQVIFDFFLMHCLNASMFWSVFLNLDWITDEQKCRMLEMKGWVDLAMYVGMGSPELRVEEIKEYQPKSPGGWDSILAQVLKYDTDDAHTPKLIRALLHAQQVCQPYEKEQGWPVQGDMWLQLAHMGMCLVCVSLPPTSPPVTLSTPRPSSAPLLSTFFPHELPSYSLLLILPLRISNGLCYDTRRRPQRSRWRLLPLGSQSWLL